MHLPEWKQHQLQHYSLTSCQTVSIHYKCIKLGRVFLCECTSTSSIEKRVVFHISDSCFNSIYCTSTLYWIKNFTWLSTLARQRSSFHSQLLTSAKVVEASASTHARASPTQTIRLKNRKGSNTWQKKYILYCLRLQYLSFTPLMHVLVRNSMFWLHN